MSDEYYKGDPSQESIQVDTKSETDKKCPSCGGVMDFDPASGGLACPFCGFKQEIAVADRNFTAVELDFNSAEDEENCDWGTTTKTVICKSCGAATVYEQKQIANECPYCGSNQVMEEASGNVMAPGGVVLFKINMQTAAERFKKWIGGKFFCPKLAKESAKPEAFHGLYVPFWTFDTDTESRYNGEYGIDSSYKDKDGNTKTRTDWYRVSGRYSESFDDVLVCGSSEQKEAMIGALEPFDTKQVVQYKPEYMAGFSAERYTVKMKNAWEKAKEKIKRILRRNVESKVRTEKSADSVRNMNINTEFNNITYKYLLLPIWISSFKYNNKVYNFMVNGQTGKVSGNTPISWIKVAITVIVVIAAIAIIMHFLNQDSNAAEYMIKSM